VVFREFGRDLPLQKIRSHFDQAKNLCWWFYPAPGSGGKLTDAMVYNLNNERWGHVTLPIETVFQFQNAETNYDNWPADGSVTFDTLPDLPFDSQAFDTSSSAMGVVSTDHKVKTMTGRCAAASLTTGDLGDDEQYTTLSQVTPRFKQRAAAASLTHYTRNFDGDVLEEPRHQRTLRQPLRHPGVGALPPRPPRPAG
jgi:hypothetical protein